MLSLDSRAVNVSVTAFLVTSKQDPKIFTCATLGSDARHTPSYTSRNDVMFNGSASLSAALSQEEQVPPGLGRHSAAWQCQRMTSERPG